MAGTVCGDHKRYDLSVNSTRELMRSEAHRTVWTSAYIERADGRRNGCQALLQAFKYTFAVNVLLQAL